MTERDEIYSRPQDVVGGFKFDQQVVDVFPDMINRSVPGYSTIINMIGQLSERFAQSDTNLYDLGCSLGAATLAMRHNVTQNKVKILAIDNSPQMVDSCRNTIAKDTSDVPVEVICADITETPLYNASVCVLNFTLQFVPLHLRCNFVKKIAQALKPGGVLILSEKISFADSEHQALMVDLHHNYKRANGYSDLEIAQKRSALENVLLPESLQTHQKRLLDAGFKTANSWFQCFNFTSIIAIK